MRVGSVMPTTSDKAYQMFSEEMVRPWQSEAAKLQNSQTVLDIVSAQHLRFKSSKRLYVRISQKLPSVIFPCVSKPKIFSYSELTLISFVSSDQTMLGSQPVHVEQDCFYFETKIKSLNDRKMTLVGFSSRKTAKQMAAETPNQLGQGDEGWSYGLRADGMLFKKGVKESGARFNILKKNGVNSAAFEGYKEGDIIGCGLMLE